MADQPKKKMSRAQKKEAEHEENLRHWLAEERKIQDLWEKAYNPGGDAQNQRLAKQGKKPPRQLIRQLIDPGTEFFELSRGAGFGIGYEGVEDVPSAGLVTGIGKIHGNWVMMLANDSRVTAGAYYPISCKTHLRAQEGVDVGRGDAVGGDRGIGGVGAADVAAMEPKVGEEEFFLAGRLLQGAGLDQAKGRVLEGFAAGKEIVFAEGVDFPVAVEQVDPMRGEVPRHGNAGMGGRVVAGVRRQQDQKRAVVGQFILQVPFVGADDDEEAVVARGDLAEGVPVEASRQRGGGEDLLGLGGVDADAVGGEEGGDQGAVGAEMAFGDGWNGAQGDAGSVGARAGRSGAPGGEDEQERKDGAPLPFSKEVGQGRRHGKS